MVVSLLAAHADLHLVVARVPRRLEEVLRQELALLVEVIAGTLGTVGSAILQADTDMGDGHSQPRCAVALCSSWR